MAQTPDLRKLTLYERPDGSLFAVTYDEKKCLYRLSENPLVKRTATTLSVTGEVAHEHGWTSLDELLSVICPDARLVV